MMLCARLDGPDDLGRISTVTSYDDVSTGSPTAVNQIEYTYGTHGRITEAELEHDGAVDGSTLSVQYAYDTSATSSIYSDGLRPESVTYPGSRVTYLDYGAADGYNDRLGRVYRLRDTGSSGTILSAYSHNGTGRLVYLDYPGPNIQLDYYQGTAGTYAGFDRFGAIYDQYWKAYTSRVATQVKYRHDYAGNRISREDLHADLSSVGKQDELYTYDDLHRLTNAERGDLDGTYTSISNRQFEQDWGLDAEGNWAGFKERDTDVSSWDVDQTRVHNDVNEIDNPSGGSITGTGGDWYDPVYDSAGNMTRGPLPSSPTTYQDYAYDAWNRLVEVKDNTGATVAAFAYDGLNRRIEKTVGGTTEHYYYHEAYQVLEVRQDGVSDPVEEYVWHPHYVDALAVRYHDTDTDGDFADNSEEQFACFDGNYNVSVLIGNVGVIERYHYTPYGEITAVSGKTADFNLDGVVDTSDYNIWNTNNPAGPGKTHAEGDANGDGYVTVTDYNAWNTQKFTYESSLAASAISNPVTYTGRRLDSETGLYYYRARYYDPKLGRFLTRDPIEYRGSQWNLYQYTNSNPTSYIDPLGLGTYHHWFMRYWKTPGKGQEKVDAMCPDFAGEFDINSFTTLYTKQEHNWITHWILSDGEQSFGPYQTLYEGVEAMDSDCCDSHWCRSSHGRRRGRRSRVAEARHEQVDPRPRGPHRF